MPWDVFLIFDTSAVTFVLPFVRRYSASALAVYSRVNARRSLARARESHSDQRKENDISISIRPDTRGFMGNDMVSTLQRRSARATTKSLVKP